MMSDTSKRAAGWRRWARARVYVIPVLVLLAITLPHLEQGDFRTDTGWYSAIGLSTVRHWGEASGIGDLLTLQAEPGKPFFNKPPLALWIHGIVLYVMGVSLGAARLPTIAAACACVVLTIAIVRRFGTRSQATMAGVALALTLEFFRRTKEISLDMWQLVFMLGAVLVTAAAVRRGGKVGAWNALASGALIGLALLCKPLVALLASVVLVVWLGRGVEASGVGHQAKTAWGRWLVLHLAAAVVVAAPWYVVMGIEHGDAFLRKHFVGEVAERAAGDAGKSGGGAEPAWFYAKLLLETYWPWLATLALGVVALARREFAARGRALGVLAVMWFAAWFVLLTAFPDRRPRYALVLWPAGAMVAGQWLGLPAARVMRGLVRGVVRWGAAAAVVGGVVFAALPVRVQRPPSPQWPAFFAWMEGHGVKELWQGSVSGPTGARLYLEFGAWPRQTQDRQQRIVAAPPAGVLLLYHRRDGYAPGAGEEVVFHEGDLTVTRLVSGVWEPVKTADPGEGE